MPKMELKRKDASDDSHKAFELRHWLLFSLAMVLAIFMVHMNAFDFHASVIPTSQAPAFDGTALPVLKVPKWTSLTNEERKAHYSQIPSDKFIPFPFYDPAQLKMSTESLGWSDAADLAIRNAKITFSVPYMGNYKLDGVEHAGGHPAVDIKIPVGTPIYSIGNGVVTKVSEQSTGFGHHIVVRHDDFPSYDNPNVTETYYSSYSHLDQVQVSEGDVVTRGQMIGKSGDTGTATTPHIHFQIDNSNAPWHPYWHFTFQEAADAGYNFTTAINAGFQKEKALATTINPLKYVQKYFDGTLSSSAPVEPTPPATVPADEAETTVDGASSDLPPETELDIPVEDLTDEVEEIVEPIVEPKVVEPEPIEEDVVVPDVAETETTASGRRFTDIASSSPSYEAVAFLAANNVVNGYPDGTFQPSQVVTRVEALKFILSGSRAQLVSSSDLPFPDTSVGQWYSDFVATGYSKGIVDGYEDGLFRPTNTVNRVEFLKMLFEAMDMPVEQEVVRHVYADVLKDDWFAPYVKFAKDRNLIPAPSGGVFRPEAGMSRSEVADIMYRTLLMKLSGSDRYSSTIDLAANAVNEHFN